MMACLCYEAKRGFAFGSEIPYDLIHMSSGGPRILRLGIQNVKVYKIFLTMKA
jgi:hypothetical protein